MHIYILYLWCGLKPVSKQAAWVTLNINVIITHLLKNRKNTTVATSNSNSKTGTTIAETSADDDIAGSAWRNVTQSPRYLHIRLSVTWSAVTAEGAAHLQRGAGWTLQTSRPERQRWCRCTRPRLALRDGWWSKPVLWLPLCPSGTCREFWSLTADEKRGWWFHSLWIPTEPGWFGRSLVPGWICTARRRFAGGIQSQRPETRFSGPEKLKPRNVDISATFKGGGTVFKGGFFSYKVL